MNSRDLITMLLYFKYSIYSKYLILMIFYIKYSIYSRDLITLLLYSKNYGCWMIMTLSGMLRKKYIILLGFINSGRYIVYFAPFFLDTGLSTKDKTSKTTVRN